MRIALISALAMAAFLTIGSAQAQDPKECDAKYDELMHKLAGRSMPTDQRAEYNAELLGAYQSCRAGKPQDWTGITNKINA